MADPLTPTRASRNPLWLVVAGIGLVAAFFLWQYERERRHEEELAQAQGLVRVLSATFRGQNALKVGEVVGAFDVTSIDPGALPLLRSAQKVKLPFSIGYSVDLSRMTPDRYRWDSDSRTLVVEAPDVAIGAPNIDESRRQTLATQGLFVTRGAADNLSRRAAVQANAAAVQQAADPANMGKARDNARRAIAAMLETPLSVAGLGKVKVIVRLPQDRPAKSEHWDVGPSIADVLADRS